MSIDILREMGPTTIEEGDTREPYIETATPEQLHISADLERVYEESMLNGSDESTTNSIAIKLVLGKSKGLGIKSTRAGKSRLSSSRQEVEVQMKLLQEQLQLKDEKVDRLEEQMQLKDEKMDRMQEHLQLKDDKMDRLEEIVNTLLESLRQQGTRAPMPTTSNDGGV